MERNYHYYKDKGLAELRVIGRNVGVKAPTTLKKEDLINEIVSIENGFKKPLWSTKGRPCNNLCVTNWENKEIEEEKQKQELEQALKKDREELKRTVLSFKSKIIIEIIDKINEEFNEILKIL